MRIHQVAMAATDLDAIEDFYRDVLGARFIKRYDPPGITFFDFEGVRIMFEAGSSSSVVYFWVDDIDARVAELESKGVVFESPPHVIFQDDEGLFGPAGEAETMAFFKDPAGNLIALATRR